MNIPFKVSFEITLKTYCPGCSCNFMVRSTPNVVGTMHKEDFHDLMDTALYTLHKGVTEKACPNCNKPTLRPMDIWQDGPPHKVKKK